MRHPGLCFVLLLAGTAAAPARASEKKVAEFAHGMLQQVAAVERPCVLGLEGTGANSVFLCGAVSSDFKTFSQIWDKAIAQGSADAKPLAEWAVQGGDRMRWYDLKDRWFVVTFHGSDHRIVLSYPNDRPGVVALSKGVTPPRRIGPSNPLTTSQQGRPLGATGVVVVSAVIKANGTVGDGEVLGCIPIHKGLEEAALKAVGAWRYEPARKDGAAVSIPFTVTVSYGPPGQNRVSESSAPSASPESFTPQASE